MFCGDCAHPSCISFLKTFETVTRWRRFYYSQGKGYLSELLKKVQAWPHGSCNSVDIWSVTHVTTLSRKERVPRLKLGNLLICSQLLCPWATPPEINPRLYYRHAVSQLVVGFISATWLNSTRQKQFGPAGFRKWAGNSSPSCQPAYALLEQDTRNQMSSRIFFSYAQHV